LGDRMEKAATTASSSDAEQDSGSGLRCQDTILGDVHAQTRFETTVEQSNDPLLSKVNIFGSGEDNMKILELMEIIYNCLHWLILALQPKERKDLTYEEKGKLFMELMEKRRKHFAALRAQEKRNRPPTKAQKRTQMSTYLKHI
ncbi:hypothetical protein Tco_0076056, partial [Tanacetum coccineum]